jgi:hypothetical protein
MNLFGRKKQAPVKQAPNTIEAITAIREQIDTLEKRESFVQKKIDASLKSAIEKKKKGNNVVVYLFCCLKKIFD